MSEPCSCEGCRRRPSREAFWWPAENADGLAEMWLVARDNDELLATAPEGMYPTGMRVLVGPRGAAR